MSNDSIDETYEAIAYDISTEDPQTVLLLGPELAVDKDNNNHRMRFSKLAAAHPEEISRYFPLENLFAFHQKKPPWQIRSDIIDFYQNSADPVLLNMIARIKIPLIINVCQDKALQEIYTEQFGPDTFAQGHFSGIPNPDHKNLVPRMDKPVIYNIFGSVASPSSMVLTHSELYQTMEGLLQQGSLPEGIQLFLENANSYIFLGFKYDSWQFQLTCHRLKINTASNNVLSTPKHRESNSVGFIMRSNFKMGFTSDNASRAIKRVIDLCEEKYPHCLRDRIENRSHSLYISYARRNENEEAIDIHRETIIPWLTGEIRKDFEDSEVSIFLDKTHLGYGDSIDSFMTRIGKGKVVLRIISDKYLKSRYCMDEAIRMKSYNNEDKRIITLILDDAKLEDADSGFYKKYWKQKCEAIYGSIENDLEETIDRERTKRDLVIYLDIYDYIDKFIKELKDKVNERLSFDDMKLNENKELVFVETKKASLKVFTDMIVAKLKENN